MSGKVDGADWNGYIPPPNSRKHVPPPPSKLTTSATVLEEVKWKPGLKVSDKSKNVSSSSLLGGPVPERDPSVVEPGAWKTEAQAASAQTKTSRDQLTENWRSRGKAVSIAPRTTFDESVAARLREESPYSLNDEVVDEIESSGNDLSDPNKDAALSASSFSLVGYRSGIGARSFLDGLGAKVASSFRVASKRHNDNNEE